jgi:hypothetical protein
MLEACQIAAKLPEGCWVRVAFFERFGELLPLWIDVNLARLRHRRRNSPASLQELSAVEKLLRDLPEGASLLRPYQDYLVELCAHEAERDPTRAEIMQSLLALTLRRGDARG